MALENNTLRFETKSAVSSRVNWLIWSTMLEILGLAGAAAVVSHRREEGARWGRCERANEARHVIGLEEFERNARAQHRAVEVEEMDMAIVVDESEL